MTDSPLSGRTLVIKSSQPYLEGKRGAHPGGPTTPSSRTMQNPLDEERSFAGQFPNALLLIHRPHALHLQWMNVGWMGLVRHPKARGYCCLHWHVHLCCPTALMCWTFHTILTFYCLITKCIFLNHGSIRMNEWRFCNMILTQGNLYGYTNQRIYEDNLIALVHIHTRWLFRFIYLWITWYLCAWERLRCIPAWTKIWRYDAWVSYTLPIHVHKKLWMEDTIEDFLFHLYLVGM